MRFSLMMTGLALPVLIQEAVLGSLRPQSVRRLELMRRLRHWPRVQTAAVERPEKELAVMLMWRAPSRRIPVPSSMCMGVGPSAGRLFWPSPMWVLQKVLAERVWREEPGPTRTLN